MSIVDEFNIVVAATGGDGKPCFLQPGPAKVMNIPGVIEATFYWETRGIAELPASIGGPCETVTAFPLPGGAKFGIMRFPARSAGKLDVTQTTKGEIHGGEHDDPSMHQTNSIDFEVILSGQVDIELPGGLTRTLKPGSLLVMGGVAHAWKNHYDEDCTYVAVIVGAHPLKK